jgi:uncharacterized membrane protein
MKSKKGVKQTHSSGRECKIRQLEKRLGQVETIAKGMITEEIEDKTIRIEALTKVVLFLSILGIIIASYLLWLHAKPYDSSFCNINERFNCDVVNKSAYSAILGIPVSLIGVLGYISLMLAAIALLRRKNKRFFTTRTLTTALISLSTAGFLFSLYLAYVQEFVLGTWCIMCISSGIIIMTIFIISLFIAGYCLRCRTRLRKIGIDPEKSCPYC